MRNYFFHLRCATAVSAVLLVLVTGAAFAQTDPIGACCKPDDRKGDILLFEWQEKGTFYFLSGIVDGDSVLLPATHDGALR